MISLLIKVLFRRRRFGFIVFDRENPPIAGDTITVGNMIATFAPKPIPTGRFAGFRTFPLKVKTRRHANNKKTKKA